MCIENVFDSQTPKLLLCQDPNSITTAIRSRIVIPTTITLITVLPTGTAMPCNGRTSTLSRRNNSLCLIDLLNRMGSRGKCLTRRNRTRCRTLTRVLLIKQVHDLSLVRLNSASPIGHFVTTMTFRLVLLSTLRRLSTMTSWSASTTRGSTFFTFDIMPPLGAAIIGTLLDLRIFL